MKRSTYWVSRAEVSGQIGEHHRNRAGRRVSRGKKGGGAGSAACVAAHVYSSSTMGLVWPWQTRPCLGSLVRHRRTSTRMLLAGTKTKDKEATRRQEDCAAKQSGERLLQSMSVAMRLQKLPVCMPTAEKPGTFGSTILYGIAKPRHLLHPEATTGDRQLPNAVCMPGSIGSGLMPIALSDSGASFPLQAARSAVSVSTICDRDALIPEPPLHSAIICRPCFFRRHHELTGPRGGHRRGPSLQTQQALTMTLG